METVRRREHNNSNTSLPSMYADYSLDAASTYGHGYETDRDRDHMYQPPPPESYPPRSLAHQPNQNSISARSIHREDYSPKSQPIHHGSPSQQPPMIPFSNSPPRFTAESHSTPSTSYQPLSSRDGAFQSYAPTTPSTDTYSILEDVAPTGFDESVLRALCDLDCGVPLLLDRIKQGMVSCRETSVFFKKRAMIEDEYGRAMQKAARSAAEVYSQNEGKAGSFVTAWHSTMRLHEVMAENRLKLALKLNEAGDELLNLSKEVDKNRKQAKDLSTRYERVLLDAEGQMEKTKTRLITAHEDLERILLAKEGESFKDGGHHLRGQGAGGKKMIGRAVAKGTTLLKGKNPGSIIKQEEEARNRMASAGEAYQKALHETQGIRQEYFNLHLPRVLRGLKECADEIDFGTHYHLSRYAYLFETAVLHDGSTLVPGGIEDGPGLKPIIESIDNRADFKTYMQNYAVANNRPTGPRREGPPEDGFLPPLPVHNEKVYPPVVEPRGSISNLGHAASASQYHLNGALAILDRRQSTFGIDLAEQMVRDSVEVPRIVEKCCTAIEMYCLDTVGIYRLGGTTSKVQRLKTLLDRDTEAVDLSSDEWRLDMNNVASVLKLWLRELPEPLLTFGLYYGYIEAAKTENERLRQIQLHHRVNDLPDANYATLKYLMGHLHKIQERRSINQMTTSNLSIVFGPTLLGPPPTSSTPHPGMNGTPAGGTTLQDMTWQCRAIETILDHYNDIFVDESENDTHPPNSHSPQPL